MPDDELVLKVDGLDFGVEKSKRYHQRRRGFYDTLHKILMFLIIVSGSAAFAELSLDFAAVAAVLAALELVLTPALLARKHEMLFRDFSDLAIDIRAKTPNERSYRVLDQRRLVLEKDEPPVYHALEAHCDNEVRRAWERDRELIEIGWWSWLTMYVLKHDKRVYDPAPNLAKKEEDADTGM